MGEKTLVSPLKSCLALFFQVFRPKRPDFDGIGQSCTYKENFSSCSWYFWAKKNSKNLENWPSYKRLKAVFPIKSARQSCLALFFQVFRPKRPDFDGIGQSCTYKENFSSCSWYFWAKKNSKNLENWPSYKRLKAVFPIKSARHWLPSTFFSGFSPKTAWFWWNWAILHL